MDCYLVPYLLGAGNATCGLSSREFLLFSCNLTGKIDFAVSNRHLHASDRTVMDSLVYLEF